MMLGVALGFSVQLINASALDEFSQAVQSVSGQPDLELRGVQGGFDEAIYARVAAQPQVALASPVLELSTYAVTDQSKRVLLRVVGVDALVVAAVAPALMPQPDTDSNRLVFFSPNTVFLNASARKLLTGDTVQLQSALELKTVKVAGSVTATGAPLAVMDIGAAQDLFGRLGEVSRVDVRLRAGANRATLISALQSAPDWPANVRFEEPGDAAARVSNLSRAYRVNLAVLALVALFTGAFLVFSVLSLSVAKRAQQFALLGVLGLSGFQRMVLVLVESLILGLVGSAAGIALGTGLAATALKLLGGDLGGGYFSGVTPALLWNGWAALGYGALGVLAALVGGWWPARQMLHLPLAPTLKGLGGGFEERRNHWISILLITSGVILAKAPPIFGMPLAAYLAVGFLLVGGITALPWVIALILERVVARVAHYALPLLAVERARRVRESASVAVSGVVASLSLAVALTVMVASFRGSVTQWLDVILPADLYVRTSSSSSTNDTAYFPPDFATAVAQLKGVQRLTAQRNSQLSIDPTQAAITLLARPLDDPATTLPLIGPPLAIPDGQIGIYVSEAMVDLYRAQPGTSFMPLATHFATIETSNTNTAAVFFIAGVWRDYARQSGSIIMDLADFQRLTSDQRVNDLALWIQPDTDLAAVEEEIRQLVGQNAGSLIDFASARQIRAISLKIFDRSFAVTYWLQGVAIAIGLFGVAASFSAQVLARRKEFGLLAHLGLTRRQILLLISLEGATWTTLGAIAGLVLGLAVSVVLVLVVNPQSFHWTMDLLVPWGRLLALCIAVVAAGTVTAWLAGQAAAGKNAVLAVKEDW